MTPSTALCFLYKSLSSKNHKKTPNRKNLSKTHNKKKETLDPFSIIKILTPEILIFFGKFKGYKKFKRS